MAMRACMRCGGTGYIYGPRVEAKDPISFALMIVDCFIPGGKRIRCPRCKGRRFFDAIKTNYRR